MTRQRNALPALAPLRLPLRGSQLIEASAGTGKTYTIAMLYVRLVLAHGDMLRNPGGAVMALMPPEILVVTFTEAATQELRDRIRARLSEAAQYFRQPESARDAQDDQDVLQQLRADYPAEDWSACARKLELAAEWMDEAAISTIHGWCKRMLREHAFASRSHFEQQLETDQSELLAEVVRDYWRQFFYPLGLAANRLIRAYWRDPLDLEAAVQPLLAHVDQFAPVSEQSSPAQTIARIQTEKQQRLQALKQPWGQWLPELRDLYEQAKTEGLIDGRKLRADYFYNWLDKLNAWASDPQSEALDLGAGWKRLTPAGMAEAWKMLPAPAHPAFAAIITLQQALSELPQAFNALLQHAACWIAQTFEQTRRQRAQIGFDDLLSGLEQALRGAQGERLAAVIRQQFPVALIDEFQDTDPLQYRIFERIYAPAENRQDCALVLIGDPKQAIYAFRGADIHTYLKARKALCGRIHTLNKNFRSTAALVEAVNHCFNLAEARDEGAGAFLFRQPAPADGVAATDESNPVPFLAVAAQGRADSFCVRNQAVPALQLAVVLPEEGNASKETVLQQLADVCATQIVTWLNLGQSGQAGFQSETSAEWQRSIQPGDIAVLVNNRNEASSIRSALARRGVRSVYLSDRDNVYATLQALEVQRWLAACAEPDQANLLRVALATSTLGLRLTELDALNHDETVWEARVMQFKAYRALWQRSGVLPMLRRLLFDFNCGERLLSARPEAGTEQNGERRMTDILHLAEILQQASTHLEGEHALLRFLGEQIADAHNGGGEQEGKRLRLESDAELVQVITIHKSKGLEYPVVCLPFISAARAVKATDVPLKWHDAAGELQIALQASDEVLHQAERERLAEDLRKLYVALTRARYLTWLGLAPIKNNAPSAIGYLLGLSGLENPDPDGEQFLQALGEVAAAASAQAVHGLQVMTALASHLTPFAAPRPAAMQAATACRLPRAVREHWWIGSYSSLRISSQSQTAAASVVPDSLNLLDDTAQIENLQETMYEQAVVSASAVVRRSHSRTQLQTGSVHAFPKGAVAGTFLHDLLEWLANSAHGFATTSEQPQTLRDHLQAVCQARGWERWAEPLQRWLQRLATRDLPLAGESLQLQQLNKSSLRAEMEFWLPAKNVDLQRLDQLVMQHTLDGRPRPPLNEQALNGMLKGFMDLVFEHQGRYYVADYKSNWLGDVDADADYSAARMDEAIRSHRYDLQYVIYLFALHRLLRSRLPDYDYERHVGGALYLFLRGIGAQTAGVHFERPPVSLMTALDVLFAGGDRHAGVLA
jgi:exodeoxyribonuclease V beta subunit